VQCIIEYAELLSVLIIKLTKLSESYSAVFPNINFYIYHTHRHTYTHTHKHNF